MIALQMHMVSGSYNMQNYYRLLRIVVSISLSKEL